MEVIFRAHVSCLENLVVVIHSASAYPRLQARVKRTIAYTPDGTAGFPTVVDFDQGVDDNDGENIAEAPDEDPRDEDEDTDDTLNQEVAESVTLCGREVIQYSAQNIEDVEDEDTDDTLNQEVADELDRELVEDEEEDAESSEVDGSSQDAASTETVEDSEVEN